MVSKFNAARIFYANNNWWIYMRPGDETAITYLNHTEINFYIEDGVPVAGPFKLKNQLEQWFNSFIATFKLIIDDG